MAEQQWVESSIAYHVSNQPDHQTSYWSELKPSPANDGDYDGCLFGLPVVFLTTSYYNNSLPSQSPYPTIRLDPHCERHNRYAVALVQFNVGWQAVLLPPIPPNKKSGYTQVHIALLPPNSPPEILARLLKSGSLLDWKQNPYLIRRDGLWFVNNMAVDKQVVNLAVMETVSCWKWDTVLWKGNGSSPASTTLLHQHLIGKFAMASSGFVSLLSGASCPKLSPELYTELWLLLQRLDDFQVAVTGHATPSLVSSVENSLTTSSIEPTATSSAPQPPA